MGLSRTAYVIRVFSIPAEGVSFVILYNADRGQKLELWLYQKLISTTISTQYQHQQTGRSTI